MNHNPIGWVEIPVTDMDRAAAFYEKVFELPMQKMDLGSTQMAIINPVEGEVKGSGCALVQNEQFYKPSQEGTLVYFTAPSGDLQVELDRVEEAGGKVLMHRKQVSEEYGFMALILDTEGNRIALHSRK